MVLPMTKHKSVSLSNLMIWAVSILQIIASLISTIGPIDFFHLIYSAWNVLVNKGLRDSLSGIFEAHEDSRPSLVFMCAVVTNTAESHFVAYEEKRITRSMTFINRQSIDERAVAQPIAMTPGEGFSYLDCSESLNICKEKYIFFRISTHNSQINLIKS